MNAEQHDSLLYKIVAIDRVYNRYDKKTENREMLRLIARLISDNYQLEERIKKLEEKSIERRR